ncbi:Eco29kI family restriction endonuclease [Isoptericola sp. S6320L]|uniref:Eco29kI family restriction endonuclease n=1 Tax=Isoptericola sp. S6320L TaxID=2926411 RepID=UPI001FF39644|nr:Eco29kI family restriction endonuclease [Isoptericola sp. S6320L]MCK0116968.1 Eco29kI family restriction endonuclease [Isoptericola sp. S6320L]
MSFVPAYYDPLSTTGLTAVVCQKFEEQPATTFANIADFDGAGLYAIYYDGVTHGLYSKLSTLLVPVYVGSAQQNASATGRSAPTANPLYKRVQKHKRSIDQSSLDLREFSVRMLLMPDVHIDLGENGLRVGYKPVWNAVFTGFGSNEQGSTTRTGAQSAWDTAHPGRSRTYGSARNAATVAKEQSIASKLIDMQVALCGARGSIDWTSYDPHAIEVPKS